MVDRTSGRFRRGPDDDDVETPHILSHTYRYTRIRRSMIYIMMSSNKRKH